MNSTSFDRNFDSLIKLPISYPPTHVARDNLVDGIPDNLLSVLAPIASYWLVSLIFSIMDALELPFFEQYRIHESSEVQSRNRVTRTKVLYMVLLQQVFQTVLALAFVADEAVPSESEHIARIQWYATSMGRAAGMVLGGSVGDKVLATYGVQISQWMYWWGVPALQFLFAFFVMDSWQYFWHRYLHTNKFLYKHIHSVHHRLYVPYSYGALYNHPLEGFVLDSVGSVVAHAAAGMSTRQAVFLFGLSAAKTVDDHGGYSLPFDPFQLLCRNNADYHDIHHQQFGIKKKLFSALVYSLGCDSWNSDDTGSGTETQAHRA